MNFDEMSDSDLDARFAKVFSSVHPGKTHDVYTPSARQRWREATFTAKLVAVFLIGILPLIILVGGFGLLTIYDVIATAITG